MRESEGSRNNFHQIRRLWVDGVGAYLTCFEPQVRIGGLSPTSADSAEIALLSNLSRCHARFLRSGDAWVLEPLGTTRINGEHVAKHRLLQDKDLIRLNDSVELRFRQPSALSGTARIDFESGHQTQPAVDGVILFAETCVMSSAADAHIPSPADSDQVLLIRRSQDVWCKAAAGIQMAGVDCGTDVACDVGQVYEGNGWCFRLE